MQRWDPAVKGKALRLKGRSAVAVRWEDAVGFGRLELESGCFLTDELAATVLKVRCWDLKGPSAAQGVATTDVDLPLGTLMLTFCTGCCDHGSVCSVATCGQAPMTFKRSWCPVSWVQSRSRPVLQGLLGSLEAEWRAEAPTQHTEALTLRWPALMPALSWRLRQPAGLLPALRTLDLSHNRLKGEPAFTAQAYRGVGSIAPRDALQLRLACSRTECLCLCILLLCVHNHNSPLESGTRVKICSAQLYILSATSTISASTPIAELPECPQLWPRLVALDLSHNSLGGAVPEAALASMTALQSLDMSFQASLGFRSQPLTHVAAGFRA